MKSRESSSTIIYIISIGHSGSTLIGNVLGSHSKALHIGEFISPMDRKHDIQCQYCGDSNCKIWGGILKEGYLKNIYSSYKSFNKKSRYKRKLSQILKTHMAGKLYTPLFNSFPDKDIIIDSSKNIQWAAFNDSYSNYDVKYIFIKRDLRAVWASLIRKYKDSEKGYGYLYDISRQADSLLKFYDKLPIHKKHQLHYENLVSDPQKEIQKLCNWLKIPFENQMLKFYKFPHHTFGANYNTIAQSTDVKKEFNDIDNKFYSKSLKGFKLDDRWKDELMPPELKQFTAVAGDINNQYRVL